MSGITVCILEEIGFGSTNYKSYNNTDKRGPFLWRLISVAIQPPTAAKSRALPANPETLNIITT